jgi:hypothetical protein
VAPLPSSLRAGGGGGCVGVVPAGRVFRLPWVGWAWRVPPLASVVVRPPVSCVVMSLPGGVVIDHLGGLQEGLVRTALHDIFGAPIYLVPKAFQTGYSFARVPDGVWTEKSSGRDRFDVMLSDTAWFTISTRKADGQPVPRARLMSPPPSRLPTAGGLTSGRRVSLGHTAPVRVAPDGASRRTGGQMEMYHCSPARHLGDSPSVWLIVLLF